MLSGFSDLSNTTLVLLTDEPTVFSSSPLAKPFDPIFVINCTVSNVVCCMVFGERFSYDDKQFLHFLKIISDILKFLSGLQGQVS